MKLEDGLVDRYRAKEGQGRALVIPVADQRRLNPFVLRMILLLEAHDQWSDQYGVDLVEVSIREKRGGSVVHSLLQ